MFGLMANVVIAMVFYGGFKNYVEYRDWLNLATEETVKQEDDRQAEDEEVFKNIVESSVTFVAIWALIRF